MQFYENQYYHLYNRTNNEEALFRSDENYLYFLKKYRFYLDDYLDTIGYCLMPTHFHFLVRVKTFQTQLLEQDGAHLQGGLHLNQSGGVYLKDGAHLQGGLHLNQSGGVYLPNISKTISDRIGILLSSYTKAINRKYNRHGSLFQEHSKAKIISNDRYLSPYLHPPKSYSLGFD